MLQKMLRNNYSTDVVQTTTVAKRLTKLVSKKFKAEVSLTTRKEIIECNIP